MDNKNKIIDLNSSPNNNFGEEIQSTDENTDENCITDESDENQGEVISVFNEDKADLSGDVIKTFTFNDENQTPVTAAAKPFKITNDNINNNAPAEIASDSEASKVKVKTNGITTPINGEAFSIKRGYQFRPSTIKKLNELKANSDNINIYFNEIIDAAICSYYDAVIK